MWWCYRKENIRLKAQLKEQEEMIKDFAEYIKSLVRGVIMENKNIECNK